MQNRSAVLIIVALIAGAGLAAPREARADGVITFSGGYFMLKGESGRVDDDVLVNNLDTFAFDIEDFNGLIFGGDFHFGLGNYLEAGLGASFLHSTVPSSYLDFTDLNDREIEQEFKMRMIPVTFTGRVFPWGRDRGFQPYIGGGLAIVAWRYSETGDFINFSLPQRPIFTESFHDSGNAFGPIIFGGMRGQSGDWVFGGEVRYQDVKAHLEPELDFAGDRLDLGGYTFLGTVGFRF